MDLGLIVLEERGLPAGVCRGRAIREALGGRRAGGATALPRVAAARTARRRGLQVRGQVGQPAADRQLVWRPGLLADQEAAVANLELTSAAIVEHARDGNSQEQNNVLQNQQGNSLKQMEGLRPGHETVSPASMSSSCGMC